MANVPLTFGGGSGSGSDDCSGYKAQALAGYTFITRDSNDEPVNGEITTRTDSGNVTLKAENTSKSYASGYYPNAHGAVINTQSKSATPSTSSQSISPDSNYVLSSVTVNAIPNQRSDSGNVRLNASTTSKSYAAGWYNSAHGADVELYTWS